MCDYSLVKTEYSPCSGEIIKVKLLYIECIFWFITMTVKHHFPVLYMFPEMCMFPNDKSVYLKKILTKPCVLVIRNPPY